MGDGCECVSGCHDNVSPDEWRGNVGAFHSVAFSRITHTAGLQFWRGLIACRYWGSSSRESHRERLMYSPIAVGFSSILFLHVYWRNISIPVRVCFRPHEHNDLNACTLRLFVFVCSLHLLSADSSCNQFHTDKMKPAKGTLARWQTIELHAEHDVTYRRQRGVTQKTSNEKQDSTSLNINISIWRGGWEWPAIITFFVRGDFFLVMWVILYKLLLVLLLCFLLTFCIFTAGFPLFLKKP